MTADEAKKITKDYPDRVLQSELNAIFHAIEELAGLGNSELSWNFHSKCSHTAKEKLISLGYTVIPHPGIGYIETYQLISWK